MILPRICLLLMTVSAAWAQGPLFPWWERPIARDMGFSEEQTRQIRSTVNEWRPMLAKLRRNVQATEDELKDALDAPQVDAAGAEAAIDRVVAARAELTRAVSRMSLKLRQILTAEQWRQLQSRTSRPMRQPLHPARGR
jgi:Spy/CpxP family protein refolding chaperone